MSAVPPTASPQRVEALGLGLALLGTLLAPWAIYLAGALPSSHRSANWEVVWSGFDAMLALSLGSTGVAAMYGKRWLREAAAVTAALLIVDAWFDLLTASSGRELLVAAAFAVGGELPVALVCLWLIRSSREEQPLRLQRKHGRPGHLTLVPPAGLGEVDTPPRRRQAGGPAA